MGLVAAIIWIIFGIVYVIYKGFKDETGSGWVGLAIIGVIFGGFFGIYLFGQLCISIFGEDNAELIVLPLFGTVIFIALIAWRIKEWKKDTAVKEDQEKAEAEKEEIRKIRSTLPLPTAPQMRAFVRDIMVNDSWSEQQEIYKRLLEEAREGKNAWLIDEAYFRDMQADWVYYTRNSGPFSSNRQRVFGEQDLKLKTYFDPDIPRDGEPPYLRNRSTFARCVSHLSVKISEGWCNRPKFANAVFPLIEAGVQLTEENLYPIMVNSYVKPENLYEDWMLKEINAVLCVVRPKMIVVLANTPMSQQETVEWLKVRDFHFLLLPYIQERKTPSCEELFSPMLNIYRQLLSIDFHSASYSFQLLWHGLNKVGKDVGKDASFMDYPHYITPDQHATISVEK